MRGITKIRNVFSKRQSELYHQSQPTQNSQDIVESLGNLINGVTQISGVSVCTQNIKTEIMKIINKIVY